MWKWHDWKYLAFSCSFVLQNERHRHLTKNKYNLKFPIRMCVRGGGGMGVQVTDILYRGREGGMRKRKESPVLMCQNLCATLVLTSWERVNRGSLVKLSCSRRALPEAAEPASLSAKSRHSHNPETIKSGLETGEMQWASVTWGNKGLEGKEMSLALLSLALSLCCLRFFCNWAST